MQSATVMNFRKRLSKRGYTKISIYRCKENKDEYKIQAIDPLSENLVTAIYTLNKMYHKFR